MIQQKNVTGTQVLDYIRRELSRGGALSDCINELPLADGTVHAFVPAEVAEDKLYDFGNGTLYPVDKPLSTGDPSSMRIQNDARPFLLETIQHYLVAGETNCCLFEDQLRSPSDPITAASKLDYVLLNSNIFYFFNGSKNEPSTLGKALKVSEAHVFLCVLAALDNETQNEFGPYKNITLDLLRRFSSGVTSFFVSAYDHEGFLMWVRENSMTTEVGEMQAVW